MVQRLLGSLGQGVSHHEIADFKGTIHPRHLLQKTSTEVPVWPVLESALRGPGH
jgi:hypothetical protein